MYLESLDSVPLWTLFLATSVSALLALESGYRLGTWRHARASEEKETPVGAMVASILGLLAFLLAFTFGMAAIAEEAGYRPPSFFGYAFYASMVLVPINLLVTVIFFR